MLFMTQVTLRDGVRVPMALVSQISYQLQQLEKENAVALWDLAMKCKNASHQIGPIPGDLDPLSTLQNYGFLDQNERIVPDIKRIVLNSIENIDEISYANSMVDVILRSPLSQPRANDLPALTTWGWCSIV